MKLTSPLFAGVFVVVLSLGSAARVAAASPDPSPRSDLKLLGVTIDGPPPPVPPAMVSRDDRGRVTVRAVSLDEPLVIDGRLDDAVYREVPPIGGFIQEEPDIDQPATEKTDVWIFFDDKNVYVSARCWDSHPERIVATEMRRDDHGVLNNDSITVTLDTFYDRRTGFFFQTNALGARRDQQINSATSLNTDWNQVWDAKAARDANGWTAEMVIPFKSLRFKTSGPQVWGVNFWRNIVSKNELTFLTPMPRSYGHCGVEYINVAATLMGIDVPPQRNLEIKPYAISSVTTNNAAQPVI